jgi:DNA-binding response OmpR family regulator
MLGDDADELHRLRQALRGEGLDVDDDSHDTVAIRDTPALCAVDAVLMVVTRGLAAQLPRLRALRERCPEQALLVACRSLREVDQVLALEMGADDVLDSDWSAPVFAARLRAHWRRATRNTELGRADDDLSFGALRLQRGERRVTRGGRVIALTEGEFEVLWQLASHAGHVLSRREILCHVRGLDDVPQDRSIDSRVYRIRAKLGDTDAKHPCIRTVRNFGYLFSPGAR